MECTLRKLKQKSLTKAGERATSAEDCRRVSVGVCVQQYSVQCKGYNLIGVTTVEASETRGTTALVYCLISSSLYTGTVQGWWSTPPTGLTVGRGEVHPNWLTVSRGVGSSPQGSPRALASAGRRRGQRSNLLGGVR